jgi:uncharacterized protein
MRRALGNWVTGQDFWDREEEMQLFMEYLEEGANILLTAPRRIGKTSLMREAAARLSDHYICLEVDFQKCHSPADAVVALSVATKDYLPLWNKTKSLFGAIFDRIAERVDSLKISELTVSLRSGVGDSDWQETGDRLLDILAASDKPVIVFMDEVPILVNRILQGQEYRITADRRQVADAFMSWLRNNTMKHTGRVRLVVTGSIGFEPVLRSAGLNATLNTFTAFSLGAWDRPTAVSFLAAMSGEYHITIPEQAANRMIDNLGYCVPHYVQVYFDHVYRYCRINGTSVVTVELVNEVYNAQMLSVQGHAEMSHLEERLKAVLGPELFPLALELLTEVAVVRVLTDDAAKVIALGYEFEGRNRADVTREVLAILEHDVYVVRGNDDVYRPVSKFVSDWWKARFAFGYKPALDRKEGIHEATTA